MTAQRKLATRGAEVETEATVHELTLRDETIQEVEDGIHGEGAQTESNDAIIWHMSEWRVCHLCGGHQTHLHTSLLPPRRADAHTIQSKIACNSAITKFQTADANGNAITEGPGAVLCSCASPLDFESVRGLRRLVEAPAYTSVAMASDRRQQQLSRGGIERHIQHLWPRLSDSQAANVEGFCRGGYRGSFRSTDTTRGIQAALAGGLRHWQLHDLSAEPHEKWLAALQRTGAHGGCDCNCNYKVTLHGRDT
jgi:hypothetical protein